MAFRLSTALRNTLLQKEAIINAFDQYVNSITLGDGDGTGGADTISDSGSGLGIFTPGDKLAINGTSGGTNDITAEILAVTAAQLEIIAGALAAGEDCTSITLAIAACRGGSFNDIFRNGVLRIFSGPQPTTADDVEIGTLLVEIINGGGALGTFVSGSPEYGLNFGETATAGILGKAPGEAWSGQADATATAGWFRFYPNDRTSNEGADGGGETKIRFDGAVATSGAQLNMSNTAITSGGTTTIDTVAVTIPTA